MVGQRIGFNGLPIGSEFILNQTRAGNQEANSFYGSTPLAQISELSFVQVWAGDLSQSADTDEVFARIIQIPSGRELISLSVSVAASVSFGSESITSVQLAGLPNGFTVSDGTLTVASDGVGPVDVTTFDLSAPLTVTPVDGFIGDVTVMASATSTEAANGDTATATATSTVTIDGPSNTAPIANDDTETTTEDLATFVSVLANDTDAENDPLTITEVTQGANGAVTIDDEGIIYTPNADFNGTDSFTYTIDDGNGGTDIATAMITVNPINDDPIAVDNGFATDEDTTSDPLDLLGNDTDVDGDTLSLASIAGTPITPGTAQAIDVANGTVNVSAAGVVTFTPDADVNGPVSFDYPVFDGNGGTDTGTVNGTVNAVNDAPVAVDDTATATEDTSVTVLARSPCQRHRCGRSPAHVVISNCRRGHHGQSRWQQRPPVHAGLRLQRHGHLHVRGERRHGDQ